MKKTLVVAKYTFKELIKSKIMVNTIWIAIGLLLMTYITSEFSYGDTKMISIDIGLGAATIVSIAISIFMGVSLINGEIENRTIYISLSRPVSRRSFFIGKIIGMSLILILNVIIINSMSLLIYSYYDGTWSGLIAWGVLFSILEALIILLVVVNSAFLTNKIITVINSIVIFFAGHGLSSSLDTLFVKLRPGLKTFIEYISYILPDFNRINVKPYILTSHDLTNKFLFSGLGYALLYLMVLIIIGMVIFEKKELE